MTADAAWIAARWDRWAPLVRVEAILRDSAVDYLLLHRNRAIEALGVGLPRETVARYALDDPRLADAPFRRILATAVERRRARMGRTAGQKRARYA